MKLQDDQPVATDPKSVKPAVVTPATRLNSFLDQGVNEKASDLENQYSSLKGLLNVPSFGRQSDASGALANRMQNLSSEAAEGSRASLLRRVPFDYAQRQGAYQNLANAQLQGEMERELNEAQKRAIAEQKKKALQSAVTGAAGTAVGAYFGGAGGAQIGGGIGTAVGNS